MKYNSFRFVDIITIISNVFHLRALAESMAVPNEDIDPEQGKVKKFLWIDL